MERIRLNYEGMINGLKIIAEVTSDPMWKAQEANLKSRKEAIDKKIDEAKTRMQVAGDVTSPDYMTAQTELNSLLQEREGIEEATKKALAERVLKYRELSNLSGTDLADAQLAKAVIDDTVTELIAQTEAQKKYNEAVELEAQAQKDLENAKAKG